MKFNLLDIKNKYFIQSDNPIFVGNAAEIRWLINTLEQQQQEFITLNQSVEECDTVINQLQERIKELEEIAVDLNETVFTLNMNEESLLEQNKKFRQEIRSLRAKTTFKVYEENLRLAQEIERLKGSLEV